jgi:hypothetical protein
MCVALVGKTQCELGLCSECELRPVPPNHPAPHLCR